MRLFGKKYPFLGFLLVIPSLLYCSDFITVPGINLKSVYRRLENAGFDPGPYSENDFKQLSESIKRFQSVAKLKETGILNQETWAKMHMLYDPLESKVKSLPKKSVQIYYPLKQGMTWKYKATSEFPSLLLGKQKLTKILIKTNLAPQKLKGRKVIPQKTSESGKAILFDFIAEDGTGIYKYASQSSEDVEPKINITPYYSIKHPVQVGNMWKQRIKNLSLIEGISPALKSVIESIDETVNIPSGVFDRCMKIKSTNTAKVKNAKLKLDNITWTLSNTTVKVEEYRWYAPDVGLIKYVEKEHVVHKDDNNRYYTFTHQLILLNWNH